MQASSCAEIRSDAPVVGWGLSTDLGEKRGRKNERLSAGVRTGRSGVSFHALPECVCTYMCVPVRIGVHTCGRLSLCMFVHACLQVCICLCM